jgi:hypothetical protein
MLITDIRARLLHSLHRLITVSLLAVSWVTASRCLGQDDLPQTEEQKQARQALNEGVQAFKNAQYDEAERDFLHAKQLDPKFLNARLYLVTAYASRYIPGAPSEENIRMGRAATEEFRGVLSLGPKTSPRSTAWARCCSRWPVRPLIRISFRSRSPIIKNTSICVPMIPNPITGSASLTGHLRSARTDCCGRNTICPCVGSNSRRCAASPGFAGRICARVWGNYR